MSSFRVRVALIAAVLSTAGCKNETVGKDSSRAETSPTRQAHIEGNAAKPVPMMLTLSLDGLNVSLTLPADWNILPDRSDERAGLVAFTHRATTGGGELPTSAFLDGTQMVRVPGSLAEAAAEILRHDECKNPALCRVIGRETLSDGGYLVSMKTPQSVQVEAWRPGPRGRAVRCGAEISALGAPAGAKAWLDDPAAVAEAGTSIDVICRSVTVPR